MLPLTAPPPLPSPSPRYPPVSVDAHAAYRSVTKVKYVELMWSARRLILRVEGEACGLLRWDSECAVHTDVRMWRVFLPS